MKTFSEIIYGGQYVSIKVVLPLHESGVLVVGSTANERPHIVVLKHRLKHTRKIIMLEGVLHNYIFQIPIQVIQWVDIPD